MSIELRIERLIVDGLPLTRAQARALGAEIEMHLTQMLGNAPLAIASGYAVPVLGATPISWTGAATARDGALQIAASLHGALAGSTSPRGNAHAPANARVPATGARHG